MMESDWATPNRNEQLTKCWTEQYVTELEDHTRTGHDHAASVVIVAYETNRELIACLESLKTQSCRSFETIVVDNGGNAPVRELLRTFPITYVRLNRNYRPSLARNVGIAHARGDVICFLDDDALAHADFVAEHLLAHAQSGVLGVRGRILPKSDSIYNYLAIHYDLGSGIVPSYIDVEGNSSFSRDVLLAVGGFDPQVFAGEGTELSYRIVRRFGGSRSQLIYYPHAIIYHDFSTSLQEYLEKTVRGARMSVLLDEQSPELLSFVSSYHPFPSGNVSQPRNWSDRVCLAILRRLERWLRAWTQHWFRWARHGNPSK